MQKCCNVSRVISHLLTFCGNQEFTEDLFDRYSIKLLVAVESIKVTNICMYQKLLLITLLIVGLTWVTFLLVEILWFWFCNLKHFSLLVHVSNWVYCTSLRTALVFPSQESSLKVSSDLIILWGEIWKSPQFSSMFFKKISWSPQKQLKILLKSPQLSIVFILKKSGNPAQYMFSEIS